MKFAFSSLGCPDWTFTEMITTAKDLGLDAVEIRGVEGEVFAPFAKPFTYENIEKTKKYIQDKNVGISLLATGACMGFPKLVESAYGEAVVYIELAARLKVKYIRVMITNRPYPEQTDINAAIKAYKRICQYAMSKGVTPLIETNGVLADSAQMKKFMEAVDEENSGVLWDVHHPYRYFDETAEYTYSNIGKYVRYVHIKDSVMENDKVKYKILGKGDVPVKEALDILKKNDYDSYVTLEWVKRWCPELEEGGIVFSHFSDFLKKNNYK